MKRQFFISAAFILALTLSATAALAAAEFKTGIMIITIDELKSALDSNEELTLVNTLSPIESRDKSIPGSAAIPYEFIRDGKVSLPRDKGTKLVFYCPGPK